MDLAYNRFTKKIPLIFNVIGCIMLTLSAVSLLFFPELETALKISFSVYTTVCFPVLIWLGEKKTKLFSQIILSVLAVCPWLPFFFSETAPKVLIETLLFIVSLFLLLLVFIKKGYAFGLLVTTVYYLMQLFSYSQRILLFDSTMINILALIDGLAAVALYAVMKKRKLCFKKITGYAKNATVICALFIVFFCMSVIVNKNLNYSLDCNPPKLTPATVEERTETDSALFGKEYFLDVYLNDKTVEINVTEDEYNFYYPGDKFTVIVRKGAYGQSYYISGTWKQNNVLVEPALDNT